MPSKYIYEPWTAPLAVQQAAKCIIGQDYPYPIVDHKKASVENMARMKAAYAAVSSAAAEDVAASSQDGQVPKAKRVKKATPN